MQKTLGWTAVGVGGAGILFWTVTGILALGKKAELDDSDNCQNDRCARVEQDSVDSYHSLRTLSTVGFVTGAVFGATGAVLLLTGPKRGTHTGARSTGTSLGLQISPQGAAFHGVF
jgi:hypothetical protein